MIEPGGTIRRASAPLSRIRPPLKRAIGALFGHGALALADQALVSGVNFATTILLARVIGPQGFGVYSLAWIAILFVASVQVAYLGSAMMSVGPKQEARQRPAYFAAVLVQQGLFSAVCLLAVVALAAGTAWLAPEAEVTRLAVPVSVAIVIYQLQEFFRRYFYAQERTGVALAVDAVCYLGRIALLAALLLGERLTVTSAIWAIVVSAGASSLVGAFLVGPVAWDPRGFARVSRRHWQVSKWLMASILLQWSSNNLLVVLAGFLLGASAVGAIKAAQGLLGALHVLFQTVENRVAVRASRHYQRGGGPEITDYLRRVLWSYGSATAVLALVFAAVPEFWLRLVFGEGYAGHGDLVRWFVVIYLVMFGGAVLRSGLRAIEHTRPILLALIATTTFSVLAGYPLIHWLGLSGVMAGMLAVHLIRQFTLWKEFQARVGTGPAALGET